MPAYPLNSALRPCARDGGGAPSKRAPDPISVAPTKSRRVMAVLRPKARFPSDIDPCLSDRMVAGFAPPPTRSFIFLLKPTLAALGAARGLANPLMRREASLCQSIRLSVGTQLIHATYQPAPSSGTSRSLIMNRV